jgi:hypothetical protein
LLMNQPSRGCERLCYRMPLLAAAAWSGCRVVTGMAQLRCQVADVQLPSRRPLHAVHSTRCDEGGE